MKLRAQKLSGLGNIIVIIDLISQKGEISSETVKRITNKNKITFDQLISIKPPIRPDNDLEVDIFNRDASEAENCVNGARCLAKFIFEKGLIPKKSLLVGTKGGVWTLRSHNKNEYSVKLQPPDFNTLIPRLPKPNLNNLYDVPVMGSNLEMGIVSLGNPHAVIFGENIQDKPLQLWGKDLQKNPLFPNGINLGLAEILSPNKIFLRVYERGVGETQACGSGACAAVVIGNNQNLLQNNVEAFFAEGSLKIKYDKREKFLEAKGKVKFIDELLLKI